MSDLFCDHVGFSLRWVITYFADKYTILESEP